MNNNTAKAFVEKYSREGASEAEKAMFLAWLIEQPEKELEILLQEYDSLLMEQSSVDSIDKKWLENLRNKLDAIPTTTIQKSKVAMLRSTWFRYAAAFIILFGTGVAIWMNRQTQDSIVQNKPLIEEIVPGGNRAVLTLADGRVMVLDSIGNGNLAVQGATSIVKLNTGLLAYNNGNDKVPNKENLYNTISTPRGGQYQIILPDGSKVWLNSASSIRFPIAFTGEERTVEVNGEAYFDVKKNSLQPFKVESHGQVIEVLGTGFNISAYTDDRITRTTLVEGKIKVSRLEKDHLKQPQTANAKILSPGQQLQLSEAKMEVLNDADIEEITAWKDGYFKFGGSLESIMDKVARWYDVEVVYEKNFGGKLKFLGKISRTKELPVILDIIASTSNVRFNVEGRKVIVTR